MTNALLSSTFYLLFLSFYFELEMSVAKDLFYSLKKIVVKFNVQCITFSAQSIY